LRGFTVERVDDSAGEEEMTARKTGDRRRMKKSGF